MGGILSRVEVVRGFELLTAFSTRQVWELMKRFKEECPTPVLWERAFYELLGCFDNPQECNKAFCLLDTDGNALVDARELLGGLALMSKGHLRARMDLLFDIFDLNGDHSMAFDEVFLMLRSSMSCIRKMTGITAPPDRVVEAVTKQIYKKSRKHKDNRILRDDWRGWWQYDASARNSLKMFAWAPEDQHGLPLPEEFIAIDYAKLADDSDDPTSALRGAVLGPKLAAQGPAAAGAPARDADSPKEAAPPRPPEGSRPAVRRPAPRS